MNVGSTPAPVTNFSIMNVEEIVITGIVNYDKENLLYSIHADCDGGPITTGSNLEQVKNDFEKSLYLSIALRNLVSCNWWKLTHVFYFILKQE